MRPGPGRRPLYRESPVNRRAEAGAWVGRRAVVEVDALRSGEDVQTYTGQVLAVATPIAGTVAALLILELDRGRVLAVSLATVRAIRPPVEAVYREARP